MQESTQILRTTDHQGRVRMAGLHDAQLIEFSYISLNSLSLSFIGQAKEITHLRISNPTILNVTRLWEGSIIDALYAWSIESVPEQTWSDPENGWNALFDERVDPVDRRKEAARLVSRHAKGVLLVASCTYGGRWAALGEDVSILQTS